MTLFKTHTLLFRCTVHNIVFAPFARTVTGPPVDDSKGRWRHGGGINVPVNVQVRLPERQAREVKRKLEIFCCQVKLSPAG